MGFRTLEISTSAEIHVRKSQLEITNQEGIIMIPLEDLATIVCSGANIRMSTMAQAQIAEAGISLMIIDEKYHPSCMLVPIRSNVRQTLVMRNQILLNSDAKEQLWKQIIIRKIENQARALTLLGRDGSEKILRYTSITSDEIDAIEANAAKDYFHYLHPGLNRRNDDPVNSCLNYGYAVIRNAIIRAVVLAGFQPALGIHHDNYLNAFNLADDLIEPWRAMVDLIALRDPGTSTVLSRSKRRDLAMVLHLACLINDSKVSVLTGIDEMVGSFRNMIISGKKANLKLPRILPIEVLEAVKEYSEEMIIMRILVLLDPTNKRGTKMAYTELRKFLYSDGYLRIGTELFMRITPSRKTAEKHIRRLETHDPGSGVIRVIRMTEKQYDNIWYLTGGSDRQEDVVGKNGHIQI